MALPALDGPRVVPADGQAPDRLVIFVHGYGADGQDLIGLAPHLQQHMPTAAFVSPNAPEPCGMSPMGYQWFPITRIAPNEMWDGVQRAGPTLNAFIDAELARYGLGPDRVALVGFSQGTMMSLHVGLRRATAPAAIVGFSGALAGPEHLPTQITAKPPILLVHGDADQVVPPAALPVAVKTLQEVGVPVNAHVSKGVGHGIAPDGLALAMRFLPQAFGAAPTAQA